MVAKVKHGFAFVLLGKAPGHAKTLGLSAESMRTLKAHAQEIWTDYIAEFPPNRLLADVPNASADNQA